MTRHESHLAVEQNVVIEDCLPVLLRHSFSLLKVADWLAPDSPLTLRAGSSGHLVSEISQMNVELILRCKLHAALRARTPCFQ